MFFLGRPSFRLSAGTHSKINYEIETRGERKKRTSKKNMEGEVQAAMTARNLEQDQWRNREQWRLVSGRRRQLS
jgi:hypothetical protein